MSIELINVTKKVRLGPIRLTYENLNIKVPDGSSVALLGRKEAGLDAITKLICAADAPDSGSVIRTHSISWPIPSASFVASHLPLVANARFIARLYEADEEAYVARLEELGRFGDMLHTVVTKTPGETRSLFCFLCGIMLPFDQYIFTSLSVGPKSERGRIGELVDDLRQRAGFLLIGQDVKAAQQYCSQAYVFDQAEATYYDDMEAAIEHFSSIEEQDVEDDGFMADPELEDLVNTDFQNMLP
jgi:capsular polysaccharide transport system ATP-binding protein